MDAPMFIRASIQHKNETAYKTYKLVESVRTERGPRQRTVLNLGAGFSLPEDQWKELANRIEEIITKQDSLFPCSTDIEKIARRYARRIVKQETRASLFGIRARALSSEQKAVDAPDYQLVDVNSIESEEPRTVGAEHVVLETIRSLGIDKKLVELGFTRPWRDVAIGVIVGRLIEPSSELGTHWWLQNKSGIDELLDRDFMELSQDRVYRVSDKLLECRDKLEAYLAGKEATLFNLQETVLLYDLTNTFFEGTGKYNSKAKFGRSKEKRYDCPLVTLGLVLDGDGFPKRSGLFEGNVSEPQTLDKMLKELNKEPSLLKPLVIMDAGIATDDNLQWLKENHYDYLAVSRRKKREIPHDVLSRMTAVKHDKEDKELVTAALVNNEDTLEVEVWCHSVGKEKKEESIHNLSRQRFENELKKIESGLTKTHGTKLYPKVVERVGRLKERYSRVARYFEITIEKESGDDKGVVAALSWKWKDDTENTNGVYCLRTNRQGLGEKQLWDLYNGIRDVEDAFRCMKSDLGLRPVRHHNDNRTDGHLFITVLAYHILHSIRFKLRKKGIRDSWSTIRERLSCHIRTTTTLKKENNKVIHIRKTSRPEAYQRKIYQALEIAEMPGRTVKTEF
jgi:transposase